MSHQPGADARKWSLVTHRTPFVCALAHLVCNARRRHAQQLANHSAVGAARRQLTDSKTGRPARLKRASNGLMHYSKQHLYSIT